MHIASQAPRPCQLPPLPSVRLAPIAAAGGADTDDGGDSSAAATTTTTTAEQARQPWWKEAGAKLRQTGSAGLLAYGGLNAAYYSLAVALLWVYTGGGTRGPLAPSDAAGAATAVVSTGVKATAQRFVKVLALAWAGSQVTKPFRLGGAVLLAPAAGRVMDWVQRRLGLKRRGDTVPIIIAALVLVTGAVFGSLILQGTLSDAWSQAAAAAAAAAGSGSSSSTPPSAFLLAPPPSPLRTLPALALLATATAAAATATAAAPTPVVAFSSSSSSPPAPSATAVDLNRHGQPKRRPKRQYLPPNPNKHGWDQHPAYLRGRWNVTSLAFTAPAGAGGTDLDLDPGMRAVVEGGLKAFVLKKDGLVLLRGGLGNLTAAGWEFTPANRRLVVEVALPAAYGHAVLRLSGEVRRKPKHWCRATGTVRLRPSGSGRCQPHRAVPSSDPAWPVVAEFVLEREMAPPERLSKFERVLVWLRLEAPRFSDTKAGRRARAYLGLDEGAEGEGEGKEWNARAIKFEMWKYFN